MIGSFDQPLMPVRVATSFRTSTGVETGHRSDMSIQSILLILSHDTNPYILYCIVLLLCTYLSIYVYIYIYIYISCHFISHYIVSYHICRLCRYKYQRNTMGSCNWEARFRAKASTGGLGS